MSNSLPSYGPRAASDARSNGRAIAAKRFCRTTRARDAIIRSTIGFSKDGRMLAIDNEWIGNVGAHTVSYVPMSNGTRIMTTVYDVPVAAVHVSAVLTNTVPTAPYRGAGRPEAYARDRTACSILRPPA